MIFDEEGLKKKNRKENEKEEECVSAAESW